MSNTPSTPDTADALMEWLEAFPLRQVELRLGTLIEQRRELDGEIRFLQNQIIRYRQYLTDLNPEEEEETDSVGVLAQDQAPQEYPPKRQAVLRLLAEAPGRSWKLSDIRDVLIQRRWLEDSEKARHALQVTVLNMAKRGDIEKPRKGIYRVSGGRVATARRLHRAMSEGEA